MGISFQFRVHPQAELPFEFAAIVVIVFRWLSRRLVCLYHLDENCWPPNSVLDSSVRVCWWKKHGHHRDVDTALRDVCIW